MKNKLFLPIICAFALAPLASQEALISSTEKYYDLLALDGYAERPYLNYRTLSDSVWTITNQTANLWAANNLGATRPLGDDFQFRIYGPEIFSSFNTAAPYGQNDGALWQGKGLNTSLSGGVRLEGYGFELTLKPQVVFSQNLAFDLMASAYDSEFGYIWSYNNSKNRCVDAPQRFGDDPFFTLSWGDSEIRYSWKTVTAGFGTQSPWLGPGQIQSLLHSNNASPYPKIDAGIRKTPLSLWGWYAGDVEGRLWAGYLSESSYFDNNDSNDHNLISGLSLGFAPSFLPGLTLSANRTFLAAWTPDNFVYIAELFLVSLKNRNQVQGSEDQRASLGFSYLVPKGGIEVYGELGIDDYVSGTTGYIRYPFHTMIYTGGFRKSVSISETRKIRGVLTAEWTTLELSQDFQFQWPSTFYGHHQITQGYTNGGQWLGPGIGTGGNSQYLGFKVYYPKGNVDLSVLRANPDNDFLYKNTIKNDEQADIVGTDPDFKRFKASLAIGLRSVYFVNERFSVNGGFTFNPILNQNYIEGNTVYNFAFEMGMTGYL